MKNFFSLNYLYELKILFFLEIILLSLILLLNESGNNLISFLLQKNPFNLYALIISIAIWLLSSSIDPKKYFNFFTFIALIPFTYGCFWFMITFMK